MSHPDTSLHIYQRQVSAEFHDSLSVIASLISPGQTLLDLGMGTGGLGKFLQQAHAVVADGVSLNPAEADMASAYYRRALVADLDQVDLIALFGDQRYDCIVCADVLEHLKQPERILAQAATLLAPGGRLITSVPNAGYCGLVAELIQGDFRYRPEGLLDNTHLRFFTRRSLQRFFSDNQWATQSTQTIRRELNKSEFQVAFDSLAPSVARHLLALPDALTYQFISVLQPMGAVSGLAAGSTQILSNQAVVVNPTASAVFSVQLYLATQNGYDEGLKLVASGRIGDPHQTVSFAIAAHSQPYTRIRLDPADRPGFFKLHRLTIHLPDGELVWQWRAVSDPLEALSCAPHHQMAFAPPWEFSASALLMLHGDDPWLELPIGPDALQKIAHTGATLEVCAGWPMSADYVQASSTMDAMQVQHQQTDDLQRLEIDRLTAHNWQIETLQRHTNSELDALRRGAIDSLDEKQRLIGELRSTQKERTTALQQVTQITAHVESIEKSTMFRATRPLSNLKGRVDRLLGRGPNRQPSALTSLQARPQSQPQPLPGHPVDIIVPVYRGLEDTRRCLESALATPGNAAWRLIIINDFSPEPEVTAWLREFATRDPRIQLLENSENLGFVATVNRGMSLSQTNDVLLLNSDTEVANDWVDRMQRAAYSDPRVASVTPFSNNATIFSYPRFCEANAMPDGTTTAGLDALFASQLAGQTVAVPTAVGFCMYIRRLCLAEVGLFDVANFGKGYGEENDFCVRASEAGWTHLHALDTFVHHAGGVSFGDSKSERELAAMQTLRRLHPGYEADVQAFLQIDSAAPARLQIDIARITQTGRRVILNVLHDREGGTLRHVREMNQHLAAQVAYLRLTPSAGGVELKLEGLHEAFALQFSMPQEHAKLLQTLTELQLSHVHYHHLLGHAPEICDLPRQLGVTHDFTAHDFHTYCPQISLTDHTDTYCGERGIEQCRQCVQRNPAPGGESIESWRDRHGRLVSEARTVFAPSQDTARRMKHFASLANVQVIPHSVLEPIALAHPKPAPCYFGSGQTLKIVVLGALSKIKGADVLEEVATLAATHNSPIEFHLLGYAYRNLRKHPKARLTVHGAYDDKDLADLLKWLQPDLIWFPAVWPETYSYTLSASLESGLPIVAPNLGAFAERLQNREWTWVCEWQQTARQWLAFFEQTREQNFCTNTPPAPVQSKAGFPNGADPVKLPSYGNGSQTPPYRGNYLKDLKPSKPLTEDALIQFQASIADHLKSHRDSAKLGNSIKSTSLRTLLRLRSSPALSPLARLIPGHLQRRVKSWLRG